MRKLNGQKIQEKKEKITVVQVIEKGEKRNKKDENGVRFFINVGKMDGVSKRDLVDFISETANIKRSSLGTIKIQKNCAFFEVDKKQSKNIASSFKGIYVDGRG